MDLTVHHVGLVVRDIERSKDFYGSLGFEIEAEKADDSKTLVFMRRGAFLLELFCYRETPSPAVSEGRTLGFKHLAFSVDDVDTALVELREIGIVDAATEIMVTPAGWRLLFFNDPDGIEIELMERGSGI